VDGEGWVEVSGTLFFKFSQSNKGLPPPNWFLFTPPETLPSSGSIHIPFVLLFFVVTLTPVSQFPAFYFPELLLGGRIFELFYSFRLRTGPDPPYQLGFLVSLIFPPKQNGSFCGRCLAKARVPGFLPFCSCFPKKPKDQGAHFGPRILRLCLRRAVPGPPWGMQQEVVNYPTFWSLFVICPP